MEKRTEEGKKAKLEYIRGYTADNYDRINIYVPKGDRERYKQAAEEMGQSLSGMFTAAADEYIKNASERISLSELITRLNS